MKPTSTRQQADALCFTQFQNLTTLRITKYEMLDLIYKIVTNVGLMYKITKLMYINACKPFAFVLETYAMHILFY